ncbi:MAG: hypothetical protein ACKOWC_01560 [Limnohabitans sp.]
MSALRLCVFLVSVWAMGVQVAAQNLSSDPMRPPPEWLAAQPTEPLQAPQEVSFRPSIIVRSPARSAAWLNGQPIRVGQVIGDSRVIRIERHRVVLENGAVIQMLEAARLKKYGDAK